MKQPINRHALLHAFSDVDAELVEDALADRKPKRRTAALWVRAGALAAGLLLAVGIGVYGINRFNRRTGETPSGLPDGSAPNASMIYRTFEECLEEATHFVNAECTGWEAETSGYIFTFNVNEWIHGEPEASGLLRVTWIGTGRVVVEDDGSMSPEPIPASKMPYQVGERYLLVLTVFEDPCRPYNVYSSCAPMILPADHPKDATMYGEPLTDHASFWLRFSNLKNYILRRVQDNQTEPSHKFIKATDLETVLEQSDYVFLITAGKRREPDIANGRENFDCSIIKVLKGTNTPAETISVPFPKERMISGKNYIIALYTHSEENHAKDFYLSSRNSIFDESMLDQINAILEVP